MVHDFHPVANLFPLLSGPAFDALVADIKKNGLREPILLDDQDRIIDGRNRYRACNAAGVEPRFVQWQGPGSVHEAVLSLNLHRRHLNESQRAMVAARTAKFLEKDAAERSGTRTDLRANLPAGQFGRARDKAGALVNVSPRSVTHAAKVLHHGCPKLIALVDSGELAVSAAARIASVGRENQEKILAERAEPRLSHRGRLPAASAPLPRPSLGVFGVLGKDTENDRMLLWVEPRALSLAVKALQRRGLRCIS